MELLNELIKECQAQIEAAQQNIETAQEEIDGYERLSSVVTGRYEKILTWAELFDESSIEAKKMIVSQLINQVRVSRDYALEIDLNLKYEMFSGLLQEQQPSEKGDMKESA